MNLNRGYRKSNIPNNAKRVFEGVIFDVYQWDQELYDGSHAVFEKIVRADTVVVFPVLDDGRILLVEDSQPGRETILVAPGGRVDEGEVPEAAARRELKEETGYEAETLEPFYELEPSAKMDWRIYVYIAKGCRKTGEQDEGAGERIVPHPVTFDELIAVPSSAGTSESRAFQLIALEAKMDPSRMKELRKKFLGP